MKPVTSVSPLIAIACITLALSLATAMAQISFTRVEGVIGIDAVIATYGPNWGDFNGDGFDDVFATNHADVPTLYQNLGGTFFEDAFEDSWIPAWGDQHGSVWGDFNNDGRRDLYIAVGAPGDDGHAFNHLCWNLNGQNFANIARSAGVTDSTGRGRYACFLDVDNDGWLDLFLGNKSTPNRLYRNRGDRTFAEIPNAGGLGDTYLRVPGLTDINNDGLVDVLLTDPETPRLALFRNTGLGGFTNITTGTGLPSTITRVWSIGWFDYDNDDDQDVYLARGYWPSRRDCYALEPARLRFQTYMDTPVALEDGIDGFDITSDAASLEFEIRIDKLIGQNHNIYLGNAGVHPSGNQFLADDGQYLGRPNILPGITMGCYIWQDSLGGAWHVRTTTDYDAVHRFWAEIDAIGGSFVSVDTSDIETEFVDSDLTGKLYRNRGDGTFEDVTVMAGLFDTQSSKTCVPVDFDNDGWMDLYVVNDRNVSGPLAYNDANLLFMNNGDGTFTESAAAAGVECMVAGTGSSAAWGDFDNDGFPDLYVTNGWAHFPYHLGPHVLYHNEGNTNHWVKLKLVGVFSNRDAIGARVRISAGGQAQYRIQTGGIIDMGQSTLDLHFGLGAATVVDSVTIWWPSGRVSEYGAMLANGTHQLLEVDPSGADTDRPLAGDLRLQVPFPNPAQDGAIWRYELPATGWARLTLHDATGRQIRVLTEGRQAAGVHRILWDGRTARGERAPAGVYYGRLQSGVASREQAIILVR